MFTACCTYDLREEKKTLLRRPTATWKQANREEVTEKCDIEREIEEHRKKERERERGEGWVGWGDRLRRVIHSV